MRGIQMKGKTNMKKNNEKSIIPIFFAIDNNYAPFFSVALESIKANSSKNYQYEIYILNNGVCEEYKTLINTYQDEIYHITFVDLKDLIIIVFLIIFIQEIIILKQFILDYLLLTYFLNMIKLCI